MVSGPSPYDTSVPQSPPAVVTPSALRWARESIGYELERGRLLSRDEWLAAMERAYGADRSTWYVPPAGAIAGVVIESDERT